MKMLEFGNKENEKIMLIHGFQSPYQVWERYIEHYQKNYHIIVPVLPGHFPNHKQEFVSFEKTAKEIEEYYIGKYGKQLYAIFGMSMGGVLAATLWQNGILDIEKVVFDGSPLVSINNVIKNFMVNFYLNITHKAQKRDKRTLKQAKTICKEEHVDYFLQVLDNMSDDTIVKYTNNISAFKLSSYKSGKDTKVYFYHGTAPNEMLARKSAKYISKNYTAAIIKCFKGKGHCENSILHPEIMIEELRDVL